MNTSTILALSGLLVLSTGCTPVYYEPEHTVVYDPDSHLVPHNHRAHYTSLIPEVKHVTTGYDDTYLYDEWDTQDSVQRRHVGRSGEDRVYSGYIAYNEQGVYPGVYASHQYHKVPSVAYYYDDTCRKQYIDSLRRFDDSQRIYSYKVPERCLRISNNHFSYGYVENRPHEHTRIISKGSPYRNISGGQAVGDDMNGPLGFARYARAISERLVSNSHFVNEQTPIGIATFVPLNNFNSGNLFGMQLSESLAFEIQQYGFSIIEYKATDFIKVTSSGDFVYSRKVNELIQSTPIEYLVIGTYSESERGLLVNARIVGARSKVIVASAQQFIPRQVYENSFGPRRVDGVRILPQSVSPVPFMGDGERG